MSANELRTRFPFVATQGEIRCPRTFYGTDRFDRQRAKEAHQRHNEEVRSYFKSRPGALLEMNMTHETGWTSLCQFLQTSIPTVPFPYLNRTEQKSPSSGLISRVRKKLAWR